MPPSVIQAKRDTTEHGSFEHGCGSYKVEVVGVETQQERTVSHKKAVFKH